MNEKIKDIYDSSPLEGDDTLIIWHNQVIEKRIDELTKADVARCIRQNMFVESAYEVLLAYLLFNPYDGDQYGGEFMEKASEVDQALIDKHHDTIIQIIEKAEVFTKTHEWLHEDEREEFINSVKKLCEHSSVPTQFTTLVIESFYVPPKKP